MVENRYLSQNITFNNMKDRFYGETVLPYKYNTKDFLISDATTIYKLEKKAHKIMKSYKYTPIKHFGGDTECFQINGLTVALQLFKIEKASLKL